jgi:hypothetical protein
MYDYQGRSYLYPPAELRPVDHVCYIPKKVIHTWSGHTKGVQAIKFFPKYGHFLLSGSLDSKVCIDSRNKNTIIIRNKFITNIKTQGQTLGRL